MFGPLVGFRRLRQPLASEAFLNFILRCLFQSDRFKLFRSQRNCVIYLFNLLRSDCQECVFLLDFFVYFAIDLSNIIFVGAFLGLVNPVSSISHFLKVGLPFLSAFSNGDSLIDSLRNNVLLLSRIR